MKIKNIVYDFGGVLMDWNPRYLYQNIFRDQVEMEYFLSEVCSLEWNSQVDAGRSFSTIIKELIAIHPKYKKEIELYQSHWIDMVGGSIAENVLTIDKLKGKHRLFGLTNWSAETFPLVYEKYSFFKELEGIVVSGEEKIIKPDARIYQILLDRYKLKAPECLFIDDNKDNIIAAKKIGFQCIYLSEEVDLMKELKSLELV